MKKRKKKKKREEGRRRGKQRESREEKEKDDCPTQSLPPFFNTTKRGEGHAVYAQQIFVSREEAGRERVERGVEGEQVCKKACAAVVGWEGRRKEREGKGGGVG